MARCPVLHALTFAIGLLALDGSWTAAFAQCDLSRVAATKAELARVSALHRVDPAAAGDAALSQASLAYVEAAEACYDQLYGKPSHTVDADGVDFADGTANFNLGGRKWGASTSFGASGNDNNGPHLAGGTVTYSFMGDGLDLSADATAGAGTNVAIASLPGYAPCFLTDISAAFAAWSAVANIQFVQVADSGAAFNAAGATGDIRIGAHTFDGPSGTLAHGYYPPPNGSSAAGDIHFDRQESWSCSAGGGSIDIGIVALHEIGHALGLGHETRSSRRAVMNPTYNPSVASVLLGDDINGSVSIYGSSTGASDDALVNFGTGLGLWRYNHGVGWTLVHPYAIEEVVVGDLDGSGVDDVIVDFGASLGAWVFMNNASWVMLHGLSPLHMTVGDLDGNGRDDLVVDLPGYGIWAYYNNATWGLIHGASVVTMAAGNIDGTSGDDLVLSFSAHGVWSFRNNGTWVPVHAQSASSLVMGRFDSAAGAMDVVMSVAGSGLLRYDNGSTWVQLHPLNPLHVASGDLDSDGRDDLAIDFGAPYGVYALRNGTTWSLLHGWSVKSIAFGDLDGNGQDEVLLDFGGIGVWAWMNDSSWLLIHGGTASTELRVGDFN